MLTNATPLDTSACLSRYSSIRVAVLPVGSISSTIFQTVLREIVKHQSTAVSDFDTNLFPKINEIPPEKLKQSPLHTYYTFTPHTTDLPSPWIDFQIHRRTLGLIGIASIQTQEELPSTLESFTDVKKEFHYLENSCLFCLVPKSVKITLPDNITPESVYFLSYDPAQLAKVREAKKSKYQHRVDKLRGDYALLCGLVHESLMLYQPTRNKCETLAQQIAILGLCIELLLASLSLAVELPSYQRSELFEFISSIVNDVVALSTFRGQTIAQFNAPIPRTSSPSSRMTLTQSPSMFTQKPSNDEIAVLIRLCFLCYNLNLKRKAGYFGWKAAEMMKKNDDLEGAHRILRVIAPIYGLDEIGVKRASQHGQSNPKRNCADTPKKNDVRWLKLKRTIVDELIQVATQLNDTESLFTYQTFLLSHFHQTLSTEEQSSITKALISRLSQSSITMRSPTIPLTAASLLGGSSIPEDQNPFILSLPLSLSCFPLLLDSFLSPIDERKRFQANKHRLFIYSPLESSGQNAQPPSTKDMRSLLKRKESAPRASLVLWVKGEPASVSVTLTNPLSLTLFLNGITPIFTLIEDEDGQKIEGPQPHHDPSQLFTPIPLNVIVPPQSEVTLVVSGVPHIAGKYEISGIGCRSYSVHDQNPIFETCPIVETADSVEAGAAGIVGQVSDQSLKTRLYHSPFILGSDCPLFPFSLTFSKLTILPSCPLLTIVPSSPVLSLLSGEQCQIWFELTNVSSCLLSSLNIDCNINIQKERRFRTDTDNRERRRADFVRERTKKLVEERKQLEILQYTGIDSQVYQQKMRAHEQREREAEEEEANYVKTEKERIANEMHTFNQSCYIWNQDEIRSHLPLMPGCQMRIALMTPILIDSDSVCFTFKYGCAPNIDKYLSDLEQRRKPKEELEHEEPDELGTDGGEAKETENVEQHSNDTEASGSKTEHVDAYGNVITEEEDVEMSDDERFENKHKPEIWRVFECHLPVSVNSGLIVDSIKIIECKPTEEEEAMRRNAQASLNALVNSAHDESDSCLDSAQYFSTTHSSFMLNLTISNTSPTNVFRLQSHLNRSALFEIQTVSKMVLEYVASLKHNPRDDDQTDDLASPPISFKHLTYPAPSMPFYLSSHPASDQQHGDDDHHSEFGGASQHSPRSHFLSSLVFEPMASESNNETGAVGTIIEPLSMKTIAVRLPVIPGFVADAILSKGEKKLNEDRKLDSEHQTTKLASDESQLLMTMSKARRTPSSFVSRLQMTSSLLSSILPHLLSQLIGIEWHISSASGSISLLPHLSQLFSHPSHQTAQSLPSLSSSLSPVPPPSQPIPTSSFSRSAVDAVTTPPFEVWCSVNTRSLQQNDSQHTSSHSLTPKRDQTTPKLPSPFHRKVGLFDVIDCEVCIQPSELLVWNEWQAEQMNNTPHSTNHIFADVEMSVAHSALSSATIAAASPLLPIFPSQLIQISQKEYIDNTPSHPSLDPTDDFMSSLSSSPTDVLVNGTLRAPFVPLHPSTPGPMFTLDSTMKHSAQFIFLTPGEFEVTVAVRVFCDDQDLFSFKHTRPQPLDTKEYDPRDAFGRSLNGIIFTHRTTLHFSVQPDSESDILYAEPVR
ncbi:Transport protein particle (TRAPP) component Trs120 [Blattamonas nauphoetae]|uniref:Transport protein particle (TRAPP) component Trs120 n=1 Tax=Blattamonas nauphoetae TaxID=2049346 RepID=A0ABQ9YC72_9EUKA|nr:Transport protein particle (TRAPP) component Trs120 [Blattamonas nauphoetae]